MAAAGDPAGPRSACAWYARVTWMGDVPVRPWVVRHLAHQQQEWTRSLTCTSQLQVLENSITTALQCPQATLIEQGGLCHTAASPFTLIKKYLKAEEELSKLKYFTMQKYNLQKNPPNVTKILQDNYGFLILKFLADNRVIHKVRKTQHQNPEFGHTQGEIQKKKPAKKYISIQGGDETQKTINFGGKLSFILSFLCPERLHCCYIHFYCS